MSDELDRIEKEILAATPEEIDEYLRSVGYDPGELGERMQQIAKDAMIKSPLNPKNQEVQS